MKLSLVIPYWNGEEKIKKHLPSVLKFAHDNNVEEIIASDDASTDGTVKLLKDKFPEVTVIERAKNAGFASNVNTGFSKAIGDFVFLLNSDASPDENVLKFALPHFKNSKVFSVGCKVGDGLWATGKFEKGFFWHGQAEIGEEKAHQTLWASGGSSIFRKSIWDELGGFDSLYNPFYEEDVDLGYRVTKRGYINIWEPKSVVEHYKEIGVIAKNFEKEEVTSIAERNHLIFIWKNITSDKLTAEHKKALVKMLALHPGYWPIFLSALKRYPEIMKKREIEKKQAKITDEEIFSIFEES
ncbi:MAG: glycosyltransferase family 2 protein [Candidatus Daviesbacteria bacterium]|nr:glycosyltransferase family 2 protein [Candidatus Daviesbacteria bacterium]